MLEYRTAPKVQKLNTRRASIEEFTVYAPIPSKRHKTYAAVSE